MELRTEIEIAAPAERVWQVLTDFEAFPSWNPFIRSVRGDLKVGARLDVVLGASGARAMRFRPTVQAVAPNRELRWLGRVGVRGLFDGEHVFEIEPRGPDRVRFVQRETFRGIFVPFMRRNLERDARRGFEEMNRALMARAQGAPGVAPLDEKT